MPKPLAEQNIMQVLELSSYLEVNQYLHEGWKLINSYIVTTMGGEQQPRYILGWSRHLGEVTLPSEVQARKDVLSTFEW